MPFLELRNVSKAYGAHTVLKGVSLEVEEGEVVAIIGRSGSGKSTILRCLNGLEQVQGGQVVVDNVTVTDPGADLRNLRSRVGFVFQSYALFPHLTVERNVTLGPMIVKNVDLRTATEAAHHALEKVGMLEKAKAYPPQLSGGQQQRVAIARSLAMKPRLMLFDEITSALDPELVGEVLKVLEQMASEGMTMVIVTHEMKFAHRIASRLVFMHEGKVWEQGPAREVFDAPKTEELKSFLEAVLH